MIDVQEYIDNLRDLIEENKKIATIACASLLVVLILLSVIVIQSESKARALKKSRIEAKKLVLDQPLLIPEGPVVPSGYITSRKTEKQWSDEEVENWFTLPDSEEVEKLGKANDRMINEIIGAAP
ncbi:MAG: hypothetical protein II367_06580 [Treponema sp.]|nr:hypothetical protein [Treponema sp.]